MKKILFMMSCFWTIFLMSFAQQEKPLLTFGCFSDVHNQHEMINPSDPHQVRLRTSFLQSLLRVKETEAVDALILGGDYSSDVTIPLANWERMRQLMAEATAAAFPAGAKHTPVLYAIGNHDYEVANIAAGASKPYNAADYYSFPMKQQAGELAESDCFYETADNGELGTMPLLTAYHYVIKDFDFVVLNCGKHFFHSAWDYQNSMEAVNWVAAKLDEITADNPEKTIFFIHHLPLPRSKGTTTGKTLLPTAPSTQKLIKVLAKHPNLIYLYGHDHSSSVNKSFIERDLKQRITHYDSNGNIYVPAGEEEEVPEVVAVSLQSAENNAFLGFDTYNLNTLAQPHRFVATASAAVSGAFNFFGDNAPTNHNGYIYCGSGGRFSGNSNASDKTAVLLYEVSRLDATPLTARRAAQLESGKHYALVCKSSAGGYYALTNECVSPGSTSQRMVGQAVEADDEITLASTKAVWKVENYQAETPEDEETPPTYFIHDKDGAYLDFSGNLSTIGTDATLSQGFELSASTVTTAPYVASGAVHLKIKSANQYVHCGSNGLFSANATIGNANPNTSLWLYAVEGDKATKCSTLTHGRQYIIVAQRNGTYYQMLNTNNGATGNALRMLSERIAITSPADEFTYNGNEAALWRAVQYNTSEIEPGTPGFLSCFMGSMRYNNLNTNASPGIEDSPIVQAMMVYVYADRIVLSMKNYGQVGHLQGTAVQTTLEDPIPDYVIRRIITHTPHLASSLQATSIYDLSGRKVTTPGQGVYLVNGKKVLR